MTKKVKSSKKKRDLFIKKKFVPTEVIFVNFKEICPIINSSIKSSILTMIGFKLIGFEIPLIGLNTKISTIIGAILALYGLYLFYYEVEKKKNSFLNKSVKLE